jgi:hypothetical protein
LYVYQLKELGKGGMLLMWECYCKRVRVELVYSVCLSAKELGKRWDNADVV